MRRVNLLTMIAISAALILIFLIALPVLSTAIKIVWLLIVAILPLIVTLCVFGLVLAMAVVGHRCYVKHNKDHDN